MRTDRNGIAGLKCSATIIAVALAGMPGPGFAQTSDQVEARRSPVVDVFEQSRDTVVNISSTEIIMVRDPFGFDRMFEEFFDMPRGFGPRRAPGSTRQYTRNSVGSGFVIHPDGYIVTNAHVVAQTAERKVTFSNGREFDAQVVAIDTDRDLAVLKVSAEESLPTLRLGRSHDLMIGETVIAIGNPLGYQNTVTAGVVSATGRDLDFSNRVTLNGLIQTDASINPGNSGGPLLNVLGELIGVNTAIRGDAQNIGFAIPVDQLREVLPELIDVERRYRIICGLTVDTLNSPRITAVARGTPADQADIHVGDEMIAIDGRPIHEGIDFPIALIDYKAGQTLNLTLNRDGEELETKLTLRGRPAPDGFELARDKLGIEVEALTEDSASALGLSGVNGLLITSVEPGGPAERSGILRRDVLVAIGRHAVGSTEDLGQLLEFIDSGKTIAFTLLRVDRRLKIRLSGELRIR